MAKSYAFTYLDGTQTTADSSQISSLTHRLENQHSIHEDLTDNTRIAGALYSFTSRAERDAWVSEGYDRRVSHDVGEFRRAMTLDNLPSGWIAEEAMLLQASENGDWDEAEF
ncbi:MAG: hypothetical protein HQL52_03750 [Magnetococcales bacterium]|nr:hypothetical protein [Magnetococcales bacterium]